MSELKPGDRVKVEFEADVLASGDQWVAVLGVNNALHIDAQYVTKINSEGGATDRDSWKLTAECITRARRLSAAWNNETGWREFAEEAYRIVNEGVDA